MTEEGRGSRGSKKFMFPLPQGPRSSEFIRAEPEKIEPLTA
jgi:hypothetical protein